MLDQVTIDPVLGPVRLCPLCAEDWPDDAEFYDGRPWCRACEHERREDLRRRMADAARRYRRRRRERAA